jgi:DNA modification methylase
MIPVFDQGGVLIYCGDACLLLPQLPDESVHCVVTSPPYWGLRDYGTAKWEGGDPLCDHVETKLRCGINLAKSPASTRGGAKKCADVGGIPYRKECAKCGALRLDSQIGLESSPWEYIQKLVLLFREVRRILRKDGTLWLNMGDAYSNDTKWGGHSGGLNAHSAAGGYRGQRVRHGKDCDPKRGPAAPGQPFQSSPGPFKPKDLIGMPWLLAFALRTDGWYLRSDIIWNKPNPMPESVNDRPTKAHEYIFLLSKSSRYYYDAEAICEPASPESHLRYARGRAPDHKWADGGPGNQTIAKGFEHMLPAPGVNPKARLAFPSGWDSSENTNHHGKDGRYAKEGKNSRFHEDRDPHHPAKRKRYRGKDEERDQQGLKVSERFGRGPGWRQKQNPSFSAAVADLVETRNKRSVWEVATQPFPEAHFATFPEELITPCVLAGAPMGGTVLDPFFGSGTVGLVARRMGCKTIGIELKSEYVEIARKRLAQEFIPFHETVMA